ncbi:MAG: GH36 C-terminal domain-containing protein, partial [Nocardioides sp.]
ARAAGAGGVATNTPRRPGAHGGDVVRADHRPSGSELHGVVARDRADAVFALVQTKPLDSSLPARLQLPGLDPDRTYRLAALPPGDRPRCMQVTSPLWLTGGAITLPGSVLGSVGVAVPIIAPQQLLLLRATAVD